MPQRAAKQKRLDSLTSSSEENYLNSRQLHEGERVVFEGPLKIEDRAAAQKGEIRLKDRFAVLTQSRIFLFKDERSSRPNNRSDALAVYPIAHANFEIIMAPPLTEYNFASLKYFQAQLDSLSNYTHFVRMKFNFGVTERGNISE